MLLHHAWQNQIPRDTAGRGKERAGWNSEEKIEKTCDGHLGNLGGLPASCFSNDNAAVVLPNFVNDCISCGEYWESRSLRFQRQPGCSSHCDGPHVTAILRSNWLHFGREIERKCLAVVRYARNAWKRI